MYGSFIGCHQPEDKFLAAHALRDCYVPLLLRPAECELSCGYCTLLEPWLRYSRSELVEDVALPCYLLVIPKWTFNMTMYLIWEVHGRGGHDDVFLACFTL